MKIQTGLYALMAGVTIGLAVWGAQGIEGWCPTSRYMPMLLTTPKTISESDAKIDVDANNTKIDASVDTNVFPVAVAQNLQNLFPDPQSPIQTPPNAPIQNTQDSQTPPNSPDLLSLHSLSAVLLDGDSGRVLYGKDMDTPRPMASTTKIMTCILALEQGNLSDVCTISANDSSQPKVHLGVRAGQKFLLEDLLYSLMLESHNDSAVAVAEQIAGSVEEFAKKMNRKALSIGCENTYFVTPNGLDATNRDESGEVRMHSTTATDLARILRYCIMESPKREEFLKITRSASRTFTDQSGGSSYYCANHNAFLQMMEGALTGKTGFTGGAGYCYVSALESEGRTFVVALLGCGWPPHRTWKWEDARMLFSYGKQNFSYQDCYQPFEVCRIPVRGSEKGKTVAVDVDTAKEDQTLYFLLQDGERMIREVKIPEFLDAPVKIGDTVGEVRYVLDGKEIRTEAVCAQEEASKWNLLRCIQNTIDQYMRMYLKK